MIPNPGPAAELSRVRSLIRGRRHWVFCTTPDHMPEMMALTMGMALYGVRTDEKHGTGFETVNGQTGRRLTVLFLAIDKAAVPQREVFEALRELGGIPLAKMDPAADLFPMGAHAHALALAIQAIADGDAHVIPPDPRAN